MARTPHGAQVMPSVRNRTRSLSSYEPPMPSSRAHTHAAHEPSPHPLRGHPMGQVYRGCLINRGLWGAGACERAVRSEVTLLEEFGDGR